MEDKNYYIDEEIGTSGIAETKNPHFQSSTYNPFKLNPRNINVGSLFSTDSKYDETLGNLDKVYYGEESVEGLRAEQQSAADLIGNTVGSNLAIAATTTVAGTLGVIEGIFSSIANQELDNLWDNNVTNWAVDMQDKARESMPIYKGQKYQDMPLLNKMGTGVFWADLVQNLGFTEGMIIPSMLAGAVPYIGPVLAPIVGAMSEAAVEAVSSKNDIVNAKTEIANQMYNDLINENTSVDELNYLNDQYMRTLDDIENDAIKSGNFVYGSNMALLTLSNAIQFSKLFSRGFNPNKVINSSSKNAVKLINGRYVAPNIKTGFAKTAGKKVIDSISEGLEEVSQGIISDIPNYYSDFDSFNESMFNPEKRELVGNLWSATGASLANAINDPQTAEEFASGFLIGAIGVPMLRKSKIPIKLENNVVSELYDIYRDLKKQDQFVQEVNNRLESSDNIKSYYNGLVRHLAIQDDMNLALDKDDAYNYKTAESAQLISDIMMFDEIGHIDDLKKMINDSVNLSDDSIKEIIDNTTDEDGNGPYTLNKNKMSIEDARNKINERAEYISFKIDDYVTDKEQLSTLFPNIDQETISNSLFLKGQLRDHAKRYNNLLDDTYARYSNSIKSVIGNTEKVEFLSKEEFANEITNDNSFGAKLSSLMDKTNLISYDDKTIILNGLEDLVKLRTNLSKINNNLKEVLKNPNISLEKKRELEKKKIKDKEEQELKDIKDDLRAANDLREFENIIDNVEDVSTVNSIISDLEKEGNEVVKDYKEKSLYTTEVNKELYRISTDPEVLKDASIIFDKHVNNASNTQELSNINSIFINDETIFEDPSDIDSNKSFDRFSKAQYVLQSAMSKVNKDNKFRYDFSDDIEPPKDIDNKQVKGVDKQETGDDGTPTVPYITIEKEQVIETPIGDISENEIIKENQEINDSSDLFMSEDQQGLKKYYRPVIPEIHIEASKEGDFRPFDEVVKERESLDYSKIYKYLRNNGAFDYLNLGNLKVGDDIGFMIDPIFESSMVEYSWYKGPTIFMVHDNQIVGSIDTPSTAYKFTGLLNLINSIRDEYQSSKQAYNNLDKFYATPKTKVSKIMVGKIPYGPNERSLLNIPKVIDNNTKPIFGIIRNGSLTTNGKLSDNQVIKPTNIADKEGRLYLLIKNGAGTYSPSAVRVKHFNRNEFNLDDLTILETPMGKSVRSAIDKLANSESQDSVSESMKMLSQDIYLGDVITTFFNSNSGDGIVISQKMRDSDGRYITTIINGEEKIAESKKTVYYNTRDNSVIGSLVLDSQAPKGSRVESGSTNFILKDKKDIIDEILESFYSMNLPMQVSANRINTTNYNNRIIKSNITSSNIVEAETIGTWFTTDYLTTEGKIERSESPVNKTRYSSDNIVVRSNFSNKLYNVDLSTNTITNEQGELIDITDNNKILLDLAWADYNYKDSINDYNMVDNKVLLPSGFVLDRSNQKYLVGEEADKVKEEILKNNNIDDNRNTKVSKLIEAEQSLKELDSEFEDELLLREADDSINIWDEKKEIAWVNKVLPQLSKEGRLKIYDGIINVNNTLAYGLFHNGLVTLSNQAASGTVYHEAFHVVSQGILSDRERNLIYKEAKKKFGDLTNKELEESLAEDFRTWMQNGAIDDRSLGQKILDFFKRILSLINIGPSLLSLYVKIDKGYYSSRNIISSPSNLPIYKDTTSISEKSLQFSSLQENIREELIKKGWNEDKFNSISEEEKNIAIRCIDY